MDVHRTNRGLPLAAGARPSSPQAGLQLFVNDLGELAQLFDGVAKLLLRPASSLQRLLGSRFGILQARLGLPALALRTRRQLVESLLQIAGAILQRPKQV